MIIIDAIIIDEITNILLDDNIWKPLASLSLRMIAISRYCVFKLSISLGSLSLIEFKEEKFFKKKLTAGKWAIVSNPIVQIRQQLKTTINLWCMSIYWRCFISLALVAVFWPCCIFTLGKLLGTQSRLLC